MDNYETKGLVVITSAQMANALRKCGGTIVCDGCPYQRLGTAKCIQQMQQDAAALIDGMQAVIDQQADTIEKKHVCV